MNKHINWSLVLITTWLIIFTGLIVAARNQAVEKTPYHRTTEWELRWNLKVIDTAGVCLYIYEGQGIAAVPKTQLPPGVGCQ